MSRKRHKKKHKGPSAPDNDSPEVTEPGTERGTEEEEHEESVGLEAVSETGPAEPEGAEAPVDPAASVETLVAENEKLAREAAELKDLAQRKQAEFENYRRRTERERSDIVRHAASDLVLEILPVFDNLGRAVEAAQAAESTGQGSWDQLREGVGIIYKQFKDILERNGLEEIECEGKPFDPHVHEAVSRVETDEHPDGTIVEVFQKGYRMKDRLLRPAMVSVARGSDDSGDDPESRAENEEDEVLRQSE